MNSKKNIMTWLIIINLILLSMFLFSKLNFILEPIATIFNAMSIPSIFAVFLYYLIRPLKRLLEKNNVSSGLATALSMLMILLLIIYLTSYASSIIRTQGQSLINLLLTTVQNVTEKYSYLFPEINEIFNVSELIKKLGEFIATSLSSISKNLFGFASSIGNFFAQLILIPIIMFYIMKDDRKIFKALSNFLPRRTRPLILKIMHEIDTALKHYITSQVMVASVIGVLMFIGYVILGMPNALVLALFSFITAFIPYLGVILGILPAILISLGIGLPMVIKIIILTVIVQQLEGNVITPNITGNKLNIHPLTTIIVVTVSVYFGGFLAALISVPLYSVFKILVKNLYEYISKNNKSTFTN